MSTGRILFKCNLPFFSVLFRRRTFLSVNDQIRIAAHKDTVANLRDTGGNINLFQRVAVEKCLISDLLGTVRDDDLLKTVAGRKCSFPITRKVLGRETSVIFRYPVNAIGEMLVIPSSMMTVVGSPRKTS